MDAIVNALARTEWLIGFAVGGIVVVAAILVGISTDYLITGKTHRALLDAQTKRADKAEKDAGEDRVQLIADLAERMTNFRADHADRMRQASEDHGRALDSLVKILESKDRDIESWRTAWSLADQANHEEGDARWDEIRAALVVVQRFITDGQRWVQQRQLGPGDDG